MTARLALVGGLLPRCRYLGVLGLLCGLMAVTGLLGPGRSFAAGEPEVRVIPVAGSSDYLVFARFRVDAAGHDAKTGALLVMDRSGKTRKLVGLTHDYSTLGPPSVAGHMLFVPIVAGSDNPALINLRTGQKKMLSRKSRRGLTPGVAVPDGYLATVTGSSPVRIVVVSWSGARTSFGAPFSDCRAVDIESGSTGFLVNGVFDDGDPPTCFANAEGTKSALFDKPGKYVTVASNSSTYQCNLAASDTVACVNPPPCTVKTETLTGHLLHHFATSIPRADCPSQMTVAGNHVFWFVDASKGGRLYELLSGKVTRAPGYFYEDEPPVSAFGKIVVSPGARHHLVEYSSVRGKAHRDPVAGTSRFLAYTRFRVVDGGQVASGVLYAVSDYASPFPNRASSNFSLTVTSKVFVANKLADSRGGIKVGRFGHPGRFHSALSPTRDLGGGICGPPTTSYVACRLYNVHQQLRLFKLSGSQVAGTAKHDCPPAGPEPGPAVLGKTMMWICGDKVYQLETDGKVSQAREDFPSGFPPINALHEAVLAGRGRTSLLGLKSASARPRVLVSAT